MKKESGTNFLRGKKPSKRYNKRKVVFEYVCIRGTDFTVWKRKESCAEKKTKPDSAETKKAPRKNQ